MIEPGSPGAFWLFVALMAGVVVFMGLVIALGRPRTDEDFVSPWVGLAVFVGGWLLFAAFVVGVFLGRP